ncbi:MAG: hypothetical protein HZR80_11110 [Candidatus Heimdallarchaeota archaeon]
MAIILVIGIVLIIVIMTQMMMIILGMMELIGLLSGKMKIQMIGMIALQLTVNL